MTPSQDIIYVDSDDDDYCVVLEGDPYKQVKVAVENNNTKANGCLSDELIIVAEKGQVACRDYPHARHMCAKYPFNANPHEKYCDMCHCYVCDTRAPCLFWGNGKSTNDHCHSTDKEDTWIILRESSKQQGKTLQLPNHPRPLNCDEAREILLRLSSALNRLTVESDILTGTIKWFDKQRGYGFICPDSGVEDLFVHKSSIKGGRYKSLAGGEKVEFQVEIEEDERKKAVNVDILDCVVSLSD